MAQGSFTKAINQIRLNLDTWILLGLVLFSTVIMTYRLGWGSLEPWDEAWYAHIAAQVNQGSWFFLQSNQQIYIDHPPLGYWLMALSQAVFGTTTFAARLPSAILATMSIGLIYLTGKKLGSRQTGLIAALILVSSRWFILRSRSGNLDVLLVFTHLLIFYLLVSKFGKRYPILAWCSLGASLMAKTLYSMTLIPMLLYHTYSHWKHGLVKTVTYLGIALAPVLLWYIANWQVYGVELESRLWQVAFRGGGFEWSGLNHTWTLLQPLVHRWHKILLGGTILGLLYLRQSKYRLLYLYLFLVSWPFVISPQTKIWHLLPLLPPLILITSLVLTQSWSWLVKKSTISIKALSFLPLVPVCILALVNLSELYPELIPETNLMSDQEVLGRAISDLPGPIYLEEFADLSPSVMYYANRKVYYVYTTTMTVDLEIVDRPFSLITSHSYSPPADCVFVKASRGHTAYHCETSQGI